MSAGIDTGSIELESGAHAGSQGPTERPAGSASTRISRVAALLGALGLGSFGFVLLRLVETWRVTPHVASHHISVVGQRLSYPAANAAAVVVLALAIVGLVVAARLVTAAAREVAGARRLGRLLAASAPRQLDGALVIDDERPRAFCAGFLRPRVYLTSGVLAMLDQPALVAVLLHERHHARRRDPLRLAMSRVLANAMFFVPGFGELERRQAALAELSADENAILADHGNRSALARAMLHFSDPVRPDDAVGVEAARVDQLLGEPQSWGIPAMLCLLAVCLLALVVAIAVLAGREASGSATLAPPFLSAQPCVVVLAAIPAVVALTAVRLGHRRRR